MRGHARRGLDDPVHREPLRLTGAVVVAHEPQLPVRFLAVAVEAEQPFPKVPGEFDLAGGVPPHPLDEGEPLVPQLFEGDEVHPAGDVRSGPVARRVSIVQSAAHAAGANPFCRNRRLGDGEDRDRHAQGIRGAQFGLEHRAGDAAAAVVGATDTALIAHPVTLGVARHGQFRGARGACRDGGRRVGAESSHTPVVRREARVSSWASSASWDGCRSWKPRDTAASQAEKDEAVVRVDQGEPQSAAAPARLTAAVSIGWVR